MKEINDSTVLCIDNTHSYIGAIHDHIQEPKLKIYLYETNAYVPVEQKGKDSKVDDMSWVKHVARLKRINQAIKDNLFEFILAGPNRVILQPDASTLEKFKNVKSFESIQLNSHISFSKVSKRTIQQMINKENKYARKKERVAELISKIKVDKLSDLNLKQMESIISSCEGQS